MPPWPSCRTAGVLAMRVFAPCGVTSQTGPGFSVMSMRPSGRNAMRQGRLNVATFVIVNGRLGSAFCRPALTCARASGATSVRNRAALTRCLMSLLTLTPMDGLKSRRTGVR